MGLIKSTDAPPKLVAFSMMDIEATARAVIVRAQKKAEQVLASSRTESELLKLQAHEQGFSEGKALGISRGTEEGNKAGHDHALAEHNAALSALIRAMTAAMNEFEKSRDDLQTHGLTNVIALACAVARRVTKRQGMIDPQVMVDNLRDAMSLVVHAADVRVAVHPSQFKTLEAEMPNLRLAWPQLKHIELTQDAAISPGGARVFTAHGQVDADLDVQLDRVIAELMPQAAAQIATTQTPPTPETGTETGTESVL